MNYYIVCPAKIQSGGPELAHQMCCELNKLGKNAYMYYAESNRLEPVDVDAPQKYLKYKTTHVTDIREVENGDNIVIVPEAATAWISGIKNCKKALWWMSVDNYIHNTKEKDLPQIREYVDIHLVQSKYAYEYVKNTVGVSEDKIMYVSDYIGEKYLLDIPEVKRMNIALYNPKKGLERIKPVIENTSDFLKWIPLINLSEEDMIAYMHISKIYVDFGNHPGKDRIPREAAACGCCVVTNRRGSATYYEDVSIPDKYKIDDERNIIMISDVLYKICTDYNNVHKDFNDYREKIFNEKEKFCKEIEAFTKKIEK